jgi:type VI secretion system secreted protein VgrG
MVSCFDPAGLAAGSVGTGTVPYLFTIDGFDAGHFRVHAFAGREALSEHYTFDVVLTCDTQTDEEVERLALGRRAVLTWTIGKAPRAFYGVVAAVRLEEVHDSHGSAEYHVRFVPRLWLLRRRRRSRVFQNLSVPDIVSAVLKETGIATRWQLAREYPPRELATQYEESDYRFVTRLLVEAGIYFDFPQGPALDAAAVADALVPGDTVIFGDDAAWYPPIGGDDPTALASGAVPGTASDAPPLYFLPAENTTTGHSDKVTRFTARTTVRANRAAFRDYDPDRPQARPSSDATSNQPFPDAAADPATAPAGPDIEVYEHHGAFLFPKWSSTGDEAALLLRQKRRRASTGSGESGCPDLAPGHRFALQDHPATRLDRPYVVVSVDHRGQAHPQHGAEWKVYVNTFECTPAEVTYLAPRPKRRSTQVALTATVVGPAGEDIYVDATGQIKVQFHWDRDGGFDDRSSCWIRTMHAWGGAGWGAQFIPRVGMEVTNRTRSREAKPRAAPRGAPA